MSEIKRGSVARNAKLASLPVGFAGRAALGFGKRLAGKSRDSLVATVTQGRPGTAMPGWAPLLGPDDIGWLVDLLLQGYPTP